LNLKVGMLGLTHPHARLQLRGLELMDDVEAIYIVEEDASLLAQARDRPKVAGTFTQLDALLRRDDVPVLMVMKPSYETLPLVQRALAAGKHVMGDKPMVRTADEMARLVETAAQKNVLVGVFYCYRWRPQNQRFARLRHEGALGDRLLSAEVRMVTTSVTLRDPRSWLFQKELAGGGVLHWLGCHEIDWLRHVTGEEVTAVSAMVGTLSGEVVDVEDVATISMRLSGGALATLHTGYMITGGAPGYEGTAYDTYHALRGNLGLAWTGPGTNEDQDVLLESSAPSWNHAIRHTFSYRLPKSDAYAGVYGMDFLRAFFRAALEGSEPPITGEDNLKTLRVIEAAYLSSATGRMIRL
jgi:predicted dehydrogenase